MRGSYTVSNDWQQMWPNVGLLRSSFHPLRPSHERLQLRMWAKHNVLSLIGHKGEHLEMTKKYIRRRTGCR